MSEPERESGTIRRVSLRALLDIVASVAMFGAAGLLAWTALAGRTAAVAGSSPTLPIPDKPLSLEGAPILGSREAPIALVMFSDFECPFCARFATEVLPGLRQKFVDAGQVQLAFRHLALPIHSRAVPAAIAAECAARQSAFWPFHDLAFAPPMRLSDDDLRIHAGEIGLDLIAFDTCLSEAAVSARVTSDGELARGLAVSGTPTFFAGRVTAGNFVDVSEAVAGARPLEEFEMMITRILGASQA